MNISLPVRAHEGTNQRTSVRDALMIVFRRRWIMLGVALPIIVFGTYGTLTTADTYMATSQVLVEARSVENPSFRPTTIEYDILMSTVAQVAESIPVATRAAESLIDSIPAIADGDAELAAIGSVDDLRDVILGRISCGQVDEANILGITYKHANPRFAVMAVGAVTTAFMDFYVESQQNRSALDYYTEQIAQVRGEVSDLMDERAKIFDETGLDAVKTNNSAGIQQMRAMEYSYYQARSRRWGVENRYESVLASIAADPDYIPTQGSTASSSSIVRAAAVLDEAILDLAKLRMSYSDSSAFVLRQIEYVDKAREVVRQVRDDYVRDLRVERDIARAEEGSLQEALDSYREGLLVYPQIEKKIEEIDLQVEAQKTLLEALQLKRGEVRLKAESDQRISNIIPLNDPSIDRQVTGGRKLIYLVLASLFAVVLGLVVAVLVDVQDHRIFDRRQAERTLELPVLGAISLSHRSAGEQ